MVAEADVADEAEAEVESAEVASSPLRGAETTETQAKTTETQAKTTETQAEAEKLDSREVPAYTEGDPMPAEQSSQQQPISTVQQGSDIGAVEGAQQQLEEQPSADLEQSVAEDTGNAYENWKARNKQVEQEEEALLAKYKADTAAREKQELVSRQAAAVSIQRVQRGKAARVKLQPVALMQHLAANEQILEQVLLRAQDSMFERSRGALFGKIARNWRMHRESRAAHTAHLQQGSQLLNVCTSIYAQRRREQISQMLAMMKLSAEEARAPEPQRMMPTVEHSGECRGGEVREWLQSLPSDLSMYTDSFVENGFDSMVAVAQMTETGLIGMDVKLGHRKVINLSISTMNQAFSSSLQGHKATKKVRAPTHIQTSDLHKHRGPARDASNSTAATRENSSNKASKSSKVDVISKADVQNTAANHDILVRKLSAIEEEWEPRAQSTMQVCEPCMLSVIADNCLLQSTAWLFEKLEGCRNVRVSETLAIWPHRTIKRWYSKNTTIVSNNSHFLKHASQLCGKFLHSCVSSSSAPDTVVAEWVNAAKQPKRGLLPVCEAMSEPQLRHFLSKKMNDNCCGVLRQVETHLTGQLLTVQWTAEGQTAGTFKVIQWPERVKAKGERDSLDEAQELDTGSDVLQLVQ